MELRERIQAEMDAKGMTRADLISLTGLKKSTVYMFFQRNIDLSLESVKAIANAFNVTLDYLITGKETTQEPQKPYAMELYEGLSDDAKSIILHSIETMYKLENGELPSRINNLVLTKFDK